MFRALFKLVILLIVIAVAAGFYFGWLGSPDGKVERESIEAAGRTASERAKVIGAQAKDVLEDGALTAKIKAKMALDDKVKALDLNVDTSNRVVTVTGTVRSSDERDRALQLARETDGVLKVEDRTVIAK
jgi:hyperosmotically inducible protein